MDRQPLKLGQLPVEILAEIVHHVDREKDLLSLCRVSRLFSHLAERDLYANVHVRLCPNAARLRLALRSRPERLKFVRNAWLHSMNSTKIKGFWTSYMFCPLLAACQNLETLELASKHAHQSDLMSMDMETLHDDLLYYQHDLDLDAWTNVFMQQKDSLEEMVLLADTSALESPNGCLDLRAMEKVNLFAGDIFQTDRESVKINVAKVLSSPGYYRMLDETCPAWDQWTEVDEDLLRFERLERQEFQYDITRSPEVGRIYDISDLDDMLFEDDFDGMDEDDWM
ncbi:uncharacterized protein LTHEOB_12980 [Neofusicoccum parvum]|uniref:Uncharacterized protein LTHEOB_12980 n=1 Tax=Neofusicoccum parvum TaxID=310453 RepID=A0ACB5RXE5_9PEZI|nr:uncharacterized protein LTHEOB_12980 [Neofusicoccum parvum]